MCTDQAGVERLKAHLKSLAPVVEPGAVAPSGAAPNRQDGGDGGRETEDDKAAKRLLGIEDEPPKDGGKK